MAMTPTDFGAAALACLRESVSGEEGAPAEAYRAALAIVLAGAKFLREQCGDVAMAEAVGKMVRSALVEGALADQVLPVAPGSPDAPSISTDDLVAERTEVMLGYLRGCEVGEGALAASASAVASARYLAERFGEEQMIGIFRTAEAMASTTAALDRWVPEGGAN